MPKPWKALRLGYQQLNLPTAALDRHRLRLTLG